MKKIIICLSCLLVLTTAFGFSYAQDMNKNLSDNLIRLHIVANSDSAYDQNLKLKLKDHVNALISEKTKSAHNKQEAEQLIKNSMSDISLDANAFLKEQNAPYSAKVEYGKFEFPTKYYQNVVLPSGKYDGLKINLGKNAGHNWWCVMYPPLCFTDQVTAFMPSQSNDYLKSHLGEEEYSIISADEEDSVPLHFKFKIVEVFEEIRQKVQDKHN